MEKIKQESSNSALQDKIQQLQSWSNECRAAYHAVVAREKHLEKNFKKEFPEVSQVVLEQLLKFYRYVAQIWPKNKVHIYGGTYKLIFKYIKDVCVCVCTWNIALISELWHCDEYWLIYI